LNPGPALPGGVPSHTEPSIGKPETLRPGDQWDSINLEYSPGRTPFAPRSPNNTDELAGKMRSKYPTWVSRIPVAPASRQMVWLCACFFLPCHVSPYTPPPPPNGATFSHPSPPFASMSPSRRVSVWPRVWGGGGEWGWSTIMCFPVSCVGGRAQKHLSPVSISFCCARFPIFISACRYHM
jgi:hypothetical protein